MTAQQHEIESTDATLTAFMAAERLEDDNHAATRVWHMLHGLALYCEANSVSLEAELSDVRSELAGARFTRATR